MIQSKGNKDIIIKLYNYNALTDWQNAKYYQENAINARIFKILWRTISQILRELTRVEYDVQWQGFQFFQVISLKIQLKQDQNKSKISQTLEICD